MGQEPEASGTRPFRPTLPPTPDNIRDNTLELLRHLFPNATFHYAGKGTGAGRVQVRTEDGIRFQLGTGLSARKGDVELGSLKYLDLATLDRVQAFIREVLASAARLVEPPRDVLQAVRKYLGRETRCTRSRDRLQLVFDYGQRQVVVTSTQISVVDKPEHRVVFTAKYADPSELNGLLTALSRTAGFSA
jgi:hypothetical protein